MSYRAIALTLTIVGAGMLQGCGGGRGGPPGGGGFGPPAGGPPGESFSASRSMQLVRFDANADGVITRDEFEKVIGADYAVGDTDKNGVLNLEETSVINDRLLTVRDVSPIIDWNGDGRVDASEFGAQWRAIFERADLDRDGTVTREELSRGSKMPRGEPGGPGGRGGPGGGPPGGPGGGPPGGGRRPR